MLTTASDADLAAVATLVNTAYRGPIDQQGWTSEASFLTGERTNEAMLRRDLADRPATQLLILRDDRADMLLGCVLLEPAGARWHLGMLTVRPDTQDRRIGRTLLAGAENIARGQGATHIRMTVISIRDTLIAWYVRRGYALTGETLPFPYGDPPRPDLTFVVLEKRL